MESPEPNLNVENSVYNFCFSKSPCFSYTSCSLSQISFVVVHCITKVMTCSVNVLVRIPQASLFPFSQFSVNAAAPSFLESVGLSNAPVTTSSANSSSIKAILVLNCQTCQFSVPFN